MVRFSVEDEVDGMMSRSKRRRKRNGEGSEPKLQKNEQEEEEEEEEWNEEEDDEDEDDGDGDGDGEDDVEDSEESCGFENRSGISVTIDPDVLECSICCEPLRPPLYQCDNGHVACAPCCTKLLQGRCPTCSHSINSRCRALENVIESIKLPCCNAQYGCSKNLPYTDLYSHQETCIYAPCFCPVPNCTFHGFMEQLSTHFDACHGGLATKFQHGEHFEVSLEQHEPFIVLHEKLGVLFLLNDRSLDMGNALSVACICPSSMEFEFMYELKVNGDGSSLQLKASATNIWKWVGVYPTKNFLLVPSNFCSSLGKMTVNVCIRRKQRDPLFTDG